MSRGYVYHAADVSYFSGKARPALPQKGLHYTEVRPRMHEIMAKTGLAFIPVLVTPEGEYWQDTSEILDRLEERHPDPPRFPTTKAGAPGGGRFPVAKGIALRPVSATTRSARSDASSTASRRAAAVFPEANPT